MSEGGSDFVDDIVPKELPQHVLLRRDFKPWHRVRKQFIRERQWNQQISRFVDRHLSRDLQTEENQWSVSADPGSSVSAPVPETVRIDRPLRCLVIPGDDFLDVRSMWHRLLGRNWFIEFLGFNETLGSDERQASVHVAQSKIAALERMSLRSTVVPDRFQNIAREQSLARRSLREYGPYDVVNLDLCDSLLPHGNEAKVQEYYRALLALVRYQHQQRTTPWLLFLTSQIDPASANQVGINELGRPTRRNCNSHPAFSEEIAKIIPVAAFNSDSQQIDISQLTTDQLTQIFGLLLGKWLVSILEQARPRWTVQMLPSYRYMIKPDTSVAMVSLSFLFVPHLAPPSDSTGLTGQAAQPVIEPTELDVAMQLVGAAQRLGDVVEILTADSALYEEMKNSAAELLSQAGYSRDAHAKWVADGEPSIGR